MSRSRSPRLRRRAAGGEDREIGGVYPENVSWVRKELCGEGKGGLTGPGVQKKRSSLLRTAKMIDKEREKDAPGLI